MSNALRGGDLWSGLDSLPDRELANLTNAAVAVLQQEIDQDMDTSPADLPPAAIADELRGLLCGLGPEGDQAARLLSGEAGRSRQLALSLLKEIGRQGDLATRVEAAYEQRKRLLAIDGGLIAGAALLILALKVSNIQVSRNGIKANFRQLSREAIALVRSILGLPPAT